MHKNYVTDLLYEQECYKIIGACMKVHKVLGKGFKEIVYKDALEVEFRNNDIPFEREKKVEVLYLGKKLEHGFVADFFVFNSILLEIKAAYQLNSNNFKQTLNYLKSSEVELGILINFGESRLRYQRIVCSY